LKRLDKLNDENEKKNAIATLSFIFKNSARFGCDEKVLLNELQQLGLPKGSIIYKSRVFTLCKQKLWSFKR
jgi:hypothetical protein